MSRQRHSEVAINDNDKAVLSNRRLDLCSRRNAVRVAERLFDVVGGSVSIVSTGSMYQPFRVTTDPTPTDHVELEMRTI